MKAFAGGLMNKPQPVALGRNQVPGTAMRRGIGTSSGTRPMTAVSGAGFSSRNLTGSGSIDPSSSINVTLEPKIET